MRNTESGSALIFVPLAMIAILATAALVFDIGTQLATKERAIAAGEMAGACAVSEMYVPDYQTLELPAGNGTALARLNHNRWASQFQGDTARTAAHDLGAEHIVGWTARGTPYAPDLQRNDGNLDSGDIRLGNWVKSAGGPFRFVPSPGTISTNADLARAIQVVVRRENATKVPGVSEGDNPIPVSFARILGMNDMQVRAPILVKLDPAAIVGEGALIPTSGGGTAVTGVMPLALRHGGMLQRVRPGPTAPITSTEWITAADPETMIRASVTKGGRPQNGSSEARGGTLYLVSFPSSLGGTPRDRLQRRFAFMAQKPMPVAGQTMEAPPAAWIGLSLEGPGEGDGVPLDDSDIDAFWNTFFHPSPNNRFVNRFVNRTWVVPVVADGGPNRHQVIGFLRVYCEGARLLRAGSESGESIIEVDLRLAPSASARNSGTLNSLARLSPPMTVSSALLASHFALFWETDPLDGIHSGPRPFGSSCASVAAAYHQ